MMAEGTSHSGKGAEKQGGVVKTREKSHIYGLGSAITLSDAEMTGLRLPTCKQVLRCLLYHKEEGLTSSRTNWESAKIVYSKIMPFYEKANIPVICLRNGCEKILKLWDDNKKIREIPKNRRNKQSSQEKLERMKAMLDKTFQMWPAKAESLIKNPEDREFLKSMKTDRKATFGSCDKVISDKIKRKADREEAETSRKAKHRKESAEAFSKVSSSSIQHDTETETEEDEPWSYEPERPIPEPTSQPGSHKKRLKLTGTEAFIPHNIHKSPKVVSLAVRMKITPTQQAALTTAIIEESGGDSNKVSSSYATADKSRRKLSGELAKSCQELWTPPEVLSLHWDSKMLPTLNNPNKQEERLAVLVGTSNEMKLLGIPSYPQGTVHKTGEIISQKTTELLNSWKCSDSVANMVFDTTASNTGHVTAACISVQQSLDRALLWSGCRHHIGELIITQVFNDLRIDVSKSPDVTLFSRFRKHYENISESIEKETLRGINLENFPESSHDLVEDLKAKTLKLVTSEMDVKRDDYLELAELCAVYLGFDRQHFSFKRPGAMHKARWMSKLLYCIKICLLEDHISHLPRGTVTTPTQTNKIREFVNFVALVYSQWWFQSSSAVDAPWNGLQLYKTLISYEEINPSVSQSGIKALKRHLWYLTGDMIPLSLFSNHVPENEKRAIADRHLALKPSEEISAPTQRFGTGYGKPKFPTEIYFTTSLADLVNLDSWWTFSILKLNHEFLVEEVEEWTEMDSYKASLRNICSVNVVNDAAERGVKMASDFLKMARTEEQYQNTLQVVESSRKEMPNLRKRKSKF